MSVVGIDFGNLNTVVAVARNRGIDVITNETSNRATPSLVSFSSNQRFMGEGAKTLEISNFKSTVSSLKRLIGRKFKDPEILDKEKAFINADLVEGPNGDISAEVSFKGEQCKFTFTQLSAMFLAKVKQFTTAELGIPCQDCVISCPNWFTDCERRALADAAHIAGLNPLRIMNDTTASALGYGITKTDLPDTSEDGAKPRIVCFVDIGHSSMQVTIGSFSKGKLVIKGTSSDRNLGGRDFDEAITQHYIKEFGTKYKMDIASNKKAVFRLRQGAEKVKKLLSAGAIAPFNIECLMNDKDVSAMVERTDFEEMAQHLFTRLQAPLQAALDNAKLTPADIDFVELVGGTTRIPKVKETLATFFGGDMENNKLSFTLNQDEAVARGCAFLCAILSPAFKVRDFSVQDIHNHPIMLNWDGKQLPDAKKGEKQVTEMLAFGVHHACPSSKMLTFNRLLRTKEMGKAGVCDFKFHAFYGEDDSLPSGTAKEIGQFVIEGIKKFPSCVVKDTDGEKELYSKATIKVVAELTGNCLITFKNAHQIEEVEVEDEENKGKTKTVLRKHPLTITELTSSSSSETLNQYLALEGEMAASDRLVIDTAEKRNALEEYVYDARSKCSSIWADFEVEEVITAFVQELDAMEDWLYGDGEDETKSVYVEKLVQLRKKGDLIKNRYIEFEERPVAEKGLRDYINSSLLDLKAEDERYSHVPVEEMEKAIGVLNEKLSWLNDKIAAQNELAKSVDPIVTAAEINKQLFEAQNAVFTVTTKPKPKPKVEEKPDAKPDATTPEKENSKDADGDEEMPPLESAESAKEKMDLD